MVCVMCLLPLFLVPIVNLLPVLFDYIMVKLYRLLGWAEYTKPERVPPACPFKPAAAAAAAAANKEAKVKVGEGSNIPHPLPETLGATTDVPKSMEVDNDKRD